MSQTRKPRRLLACAALSAGVLLGAGAASAEAPRPAPARAPLSGLLDAALQVARSLAVQTEVALQPQRRMGNTKGPSYTDECTSVMLACATTDVPDAPAPVQARRAPSR